MSYLDSVLVKNSNARRLFAGQLLSQVFDRVTSLGLIWLLTEKFDVSAVSWFLVAGGLPHLLFSLHSGKWIHRLGILRTLIVSDFFRSGLYFLAAALVYFTDSSSSLSFFFLLAFLTNVAASLFNPAVMTVPIYVAEGKQVQGLTALLTACGSVSVVLGPLIAVLLSEKVGLSGIFLVTAVAYAIAGFASSLVRLQRQPTVETEDGQAVLPSPLQVIRQYKLLGFMLISFLAMNLLFGPMQIIFPGYAKEIYGRSLDGLAWLESSLGIGMILGGLALSTFQVPFTVVRSIAVGLILSSICYFAFASTSDFMLGRWAIGFFGFFISCANVMIINLFQQEPAEKDVPSIMALANLIGVASIPLSLAVTSFIVKAVSISTLAMASSAGLILLSLVTAIRLHQMTPAPVAVLTAGPELQEKP
jgi:DHA3 family macrolide efflux protein-like MFS transporter